MRVRGRWVAIPIEPPAMAALSPAPRGAYGGLIPAEQTLGRINIHTTPYSRSPPVAVFTFGRGVRFPSPRVFSAFLAVPPPQSYLSLLFNAMGSFL